MARSRLDEKPFGWGLTVTLNCARPGDTSAGVPARGEVEALPSPRSARSGRLVGPRAGPKHAECRSTKDEVCVVRCECREIGQPDGRFGSSSPLPFVVFVPAQH
jgi:hypothetical protein